MSQWGQLRGGFYDIMGAVPQRQWFTERTKTTFYEHSYFLGSSLEAHFKKFILNFPWFLEHMPASSIF